MSAKQFIPALLTVAVAFVGGIAFSQYANQPPAPAATAATAAQATAVAPAAAEPGTPTATASTPSQPVKPAVNPNRGEITAIDLRQVTETRTVPGTHDETAGTAIGAVAGALLGRSVSGKHDKTQGTLIGGVVGGLAGNQTTKYLNSKGETRTVTRDVYTVHVTFEDGRRDSFNYNERPALREGDRVILSQGRLRRD